jgi:hypothetical protein
LMECFGLWERAAKSIHPSPPVAKRRATAI